MVRAFMGKKTIYGVKTNSQTYYNLNMPYSDCVTVKGKIKPSHCTSNTQIFGGRTSASANTFCIWQLPNSGTNKLQFTCGTTKRDYSFVYDENEWVEFEFAYNRFIVNGTDMGNYFTAPNVSVGLTLFAINTNGTVNPKFFTGEWAYFETYNAAGTMTHNFRPIAGDETCMRDEVDGMIYYVTQKQDTYTQFLAHFDGDYTEQIKKSTPTFINGGDLYFTSGKYGQAVTTAYNKGGNIFWSNNTDINAQTGITIECWYKCSNGVSSGIRIGANQDRNAYAQLAINLNHSSNIALLVSNSYFNSWDITNTGVRIQNDGVFHHVAFVYSWSTHQAKIYVDGTLKDTETIEEFPASSTGYVTVIVEQGDAMDEVRISSNIRYTANFTPPARPF